MNYRVIVTPRAESQIDAFIDYIALEKLEPVNAQKVMQAIWDAVPSLERFPERCPKASEDKITRHTARVLIVKKTLFLLFWVNKEEKTVYVEGFRHAGQPPLDLNA